MVDGEVLLPDGQLTRINKEDPYKDDLPPVFVMALIWTLYSACGHILISSIHAKNIRKAIYGQGIVPNTFGSRLSMIDSLRKYLVGLTSVKTNSKSDS